MARSRFGSRTLRQLLTAREAQPEMSLEEALIESVQLLLAEMGNKSPEPKVQRVTLQLIGVLERHKKLLRS